MILTVASKFEPVVGVDDLHFHNDNNCYSTTFDTKVQIYVPLFYTSNTLTVIDGIRFFLKYRTEMFGYREYPFF